MKKLLIILLFVGCNFFRLEFSTMGKEKWCIDDCAQYKYSKLIDGGIILSGNQTPWCICMIDCMSDSTYCEKFQKITSLPK